MTEQQSIAVRQTNPVRYALGMFAGSLMSPMVATYIALYYVDDLGLNVVAFGAVMAVYGVIDALGNPVYGFLSDRTRTRWGRRKPWLLIAAPLWGVAFIALYSVPDGLRGSVLVAYFAVFILLTQTFDSMTTSNYEALLPELFKTEDKRSTANGFRQGFMLVAMGISVAGVAMIAKTLGFSMTALILGILGAAVMVFVAFGVHEDPRNYSLDAPRPTLFGSLRALGGNKNFWLVAAANACYASVITLLMAGVAFFVKYALAAGKNEGTWSTLILATVLLSSLIFLIGWTFVVKKIGSVRTWRIALGTLTVAFVPMYFADSVVAAILAGVGIAIGYSGVMATTDLIFARIIDIDAAQTGVRREAIYTSAFTFTKRISVVIKAGVFSLMAVFYGYYSGDIPGADPAGASRMLMIIAPCLLAALAFGLSWLVHLHDPQATTPQQDDPAWAKVGLSADSAQR